MKQVKDLDDVADVKELLEFTEQEDSAVILRF